MTSHNVALWDIKIALWAIFLFIVTRIFHLKMTYFTFNWHNSIFYTIFRKMIRFGSSNYTEIVKTVIWSSNENPHGELVFNWLVWTRKTGQ